MYTRIWQIQCGRLPEKPAIQAGRVVTNRYDITKRKDGMEKNTDNHEKASSLHHHA